MRREQISQQSYIDWLKSLGCVLWLPFAEDGDLNDRISGNDLQRGGDTTGYFAWDNSQEMMYFHSPSSYKKKSYTLQTNWNNTTFPDNKLTVLSTVKRKTYNNTFFFMVGSNYTVPVGACLIYNATGNMSKWDNNIHKQSYYFGTDIRKYYNDGTLYNTYSPATAYFPSNWGSYDYFVGAGSQSELGNVINQECYVKDVMMFNRELTLNEIRQIQGFE